MTTQQGTRSSAVEHGLGSRLAAFWALAFGAAGILGFIPNPVLGAEAVFVANVPHNLVHLITAVAFLFMTRLGDGASIRIMKVFGVVYVLVGALGTLVIGSGDSGLLLGLVHINAADNYLHMVLGVGILLSGVWADVRTTDAAVEPQIATRA